MDFAEYVYRTTMAYNIVSISKLDRSRIKHFCNDLISKGINQSIQLADMSLKIALPAKI